MKTYCRLAFLLCLEGHALAQPVTEFPGAIDGPTQREQRRAELRHALKAQRQTAELRQEKRQLTPQEREELRQQLRQQHQGTARPGPERRD